MNAKEFIESGKLDMYVTGLLSTEEMHDVEMNACMNPEIKTELMALQNTFESYAMLHAMAAPEHLKEKIMNSLAVALPLPQQKVTKAVGINSGNNLKLLKILAAACLAAFVITGGILIRSISELKGLKNNIAALENADTENKDLLKSNQWQLAFLTNENTIRVTMNGTAKSPASLALIYWNKKTKLVYLDIKNLPEAPADKQYQLWFINSDNQPVSAGVFDSGTGLLEMAKSDDALAFAVTLEPRGGSALPTMDEMFVIGNVNT